MNEQQDDVEWEGTKMKRSVNEVPFNEAELEMHRYLHSRAILCGPRVPTEGDLAVVAKFERILECQGCVQLSKCALYGCAREEMSDAAQEGTIEESG